MIFACPCPYQREGIDSDGNKAGKLEKNVKANVEHSTIDQGIEVRKFNSPDRYEGGNECKTKQGQTVPPKVSAHQPENHGEEQASHHQKSDDEIPLEHPAFFIPALKL